MVCGSFGCSRCARIVVIGMGACGARPPAPLLGMGAASPVDRTRPTRRSVREPDAVRLPFVPRALGEHVNELTYVYVYVFVGMHLM